MNEDSNRLKEDLFKVKSKYDDDKHDLAFENRKKKAQIRTLNRKEKIVIFCLILDANKTKQSCWRE